jgi:transcription initiation factor TFIIE subunit alpha
VTYLSNKAVRGYISKLVGDDGIVIVEKMIESVPDIEVTDEKVAEISGINLNMVRKTLYILYENHLAQYRRERDKDSGWLTYLWKLDLENTEHMVKNETRKLIKKLEIRLAFENNEFYVCQSEPPHRLLFNLAMDSNFMCPVDQTSLVYLDNSEDKKAIIKRLEELKGQMRT